MTTTTTERYIAPRVNILEDEDLVTIEAELPGVSRESADVEVKDNTLILRGQRTAAANGTVIRLRERPEATFFRSFALGDAIDTAQVEAAMQDGVLTVKLPKTQKTKKRTVAIN